MPHGTEEAVIVHSPYCGRGRNIEALENAIHEFGLSLGTVWCCRYHREEGIKAADEGRIGR